MHIEASGVAIPATYEYVTQTSFVKDAISTNTFIEKIRSRGQAYIHVRTFRASQTTSMRTALEALGVPTNQDDQC